MFDPRDILAEYLAELAYASSFDPATDVQGSRGLHDRMAGGVGRMTRTMVVQADVRTVVRESPRLTFWHDCGPSITVTIEGSQVSGTTAHGVFSVQAGPRVSGIELRGGELRCFEESPGHVRSFPVDA